MSEGTTVRTRLASMTRDAGTLSRPPTSSHSVRRKSRMRIRGANYRGLHVGTMWWQVHDISAGNVTSANVTSIS